MKNLLITLLAAAALQNAVAAPLDAATSDLAAPIDTAPDALAVAHLQARQTADGPPGGEATGTSPEPDRKHKGKHKGKYKGKGKASSGTGDQEPPAAPAPPATPPTKRQAWDDSSSDAEAFEPSQPGDEDVGALELETPEYGDADADVDKRQAPDAKHKGRKGHRKHKGGSSAAPPSPTPPAGSA